MKAMGLLSKADGTQQSLHIHSTQHWMPDSLSKMCTLCARMFTLMRRRHHCRLCGQVFCHNCSSSTLNAELFGHKGRVRVCDTCYSTFASNSSDYVARGATDGTYSMSGVDAAVWNTSMHPGLSYSYSAGFGSPSAREGILGQLEHLGKSHFYPWVDALDGGASLSQVVLPGNTYRRGTSLYPLFQLPERLDMELLCHRILRRGDCHLEWIIRRAVALNFMDLNESPLKSTPSLESLLGKRSLWQQLVSDSKQRSKGSIGFTNDITSPNYGMVTNAPPSPSLVLSPAQELWAQAALQLIRKAVQMVDPQLEEWDMNDVCPYVHIETIPDYVSTIASYRPYSDALQFCLESERAQKVQLPLEVESKRQKHSTTPRLASEYTSAATSADKPISCAIPPRELPNANPAHESNRIHLAEFVPGVVIRCSVSHRSTPSEVQNPRILLIHGNITCVNPSNTTSLNMLREQINTYTKILVRKILLSKPTVLIVSGWIDAEIVNCLSKSGVSVFQRVDLLLLRRVSRSAQCPILSDVHLADKLPSDKIIGLGIARLSIKTVTAAVPSSSFSAATADTLIPPTEMRFAQEPDAFSTRKNSPADEFEDTQNLSSALDSGFEDDSISGHRSRVGSEAQYTSLGADNDYFSTISSSLDAKSRSNSHLALDEKLAKFPSPVVPKMSGDNTSDGEQKMDSITGKRLDSFSDELNEAHSPFSCTSRTSSASSLSVSIPQIKPPKLRLEMQENNEIAPQVRLSLDRSAASPPIGIAAGQKLPGDAQNPQDSPKKGLRGERRTELYRSSCVVPHDPTRVASLVHAHVLSQFVDLASTFVSDKAFFGTKSSNGVALRPSSPNASLSSSHQFLGPNVPSYTQTPGAPYSELKCTCSKTHLLPHSRSDYHPNLECCFNDPKVNVPVQEKPMVPNVPLRPAEVTYIVLEAREPRLGGTIFLSAAAPDLLRITSILRYALYAARSLRLETAYLLDSQTPPLVRSRVHGSAPKVSTIPQTDTAAKEVSEGDVVSERHGVPKTALGRSSEQGVDKPSNVRFVSMAEMSFPFAGEGSEGTPTGALPPLYKHSDEGLADTQDKESRISSPPLPASDESNSFQNTSRTTSQLAWEAVSSDATDSAYTVAIDLPPVLESPSDLDSHSRAHSRGRARNTIPAILSTLSVARGTHLAPALLSSSSLFHEPHFLRLSALTQAWVAGYVPVQVFFAYASLTSHEREAVAKFLLSFPSSPTIPLLHDIPPVSPMSPNELCAFLRSLFPSLIASLPGWVQSNPEALVYALSLVPLPRGLLPSAPAADTLVNSLAPTVPSPNVKPAGGTGSHQKVFRKVLQRQYVSETSFPLWALEIQATKLPTNRIIQQQKRITLQAARVLEVLRKRFEGVQNRLRQRAEESALQQRQVQLPPTPHIPTSVITGDNEFHTKVGTDNSTAGPTSSLIPVALVGASNGQPEDPPLASQSAEEITQLWWRAFSDPHPSELFDGIEYSWQQNRFSGSRLLLSDAGQCTPPLTYTTQFYSPKDIPLGVFLDALCSPRFHLCKVCRKGWDAHTVCFVKGKGRVDFMITRTLNPLRSLVESGADSSPTFGTPTPSRAPSLSARSFALPNRRSWQSEIDEILPPLSAATQVTAVAGGYAHASQGPAPGGMNGVPVSPESSAHARSIMQNNQMGPSIITGSFCRVCLVTVSTPTKLSRGSYSLSFGKFLELMFHHQSRTPLQDVCPHPPAFAHTRYFARGNWVAEVSYRESIPFLLAKPLPPSAPTFPTMQLPTAHASRTRKFPTLAPAFSPFTIPIASSGKNAITLTQTLSKPAYLHWRKVHADAYNHVTNMCSQLLAEGHQLQMWYNYVLSFCLRILNNTVSAFRIYQAIKRYSESVAKDIHQGQVTSWSDAIFVNEDMLARSEIAQNQFSASPLLQPANADEPGYCGTEHQTVFDETENLVQYSADQPSMDGTDETMLESLRITDVDEDTVLVSVSDPTWALTPVASISTISTLSSPVSPHQKQGHPTSVLTLNSATTIEVMHSPVDTRSSFCSNDPNFTSGKIPLSSATVTPSPQSSPLRGTSQHSDIEIASITPDLAYEDVSNPRAACYKESPALSAIVSGIHASSSVASTTDTRSQDYDWITSPLLTSLDEILRAAVILNSLSSQCSFFSTVPNEACELVEKKIQEQHKLLNELLNHETERTKTNSFTASPFETISGTVPIHTIPILQELDVWPYYSAFSRNVALLQAQITAHMTILAYHVGVVNTTVLKDLSEMISHADKSTNAGNQLLRKGSDVIATFNSPAYPLQSAALAGTPNFTTTAFHSQSPLLTAASGTVDKRVDSSQRLSRTLFSHSHSFSDQESAQDRTNSFVPAVDSAVLSNSRSRRSSVASTLSRTTLTRNEPLKDDYPLEIRSPMLLKDGDKPHLSPYPDAQSAPGTPMFLDRSPSSILPRKARETIPSLRIGAPIQASPSASSTVFSFLGRDGETTVNEKSLRSLQSFSDKELSEDDRVGAPRSFLKVWHGELSSLCKKLDHDIEFLNKLRMIDVEMRAEKIDSLVVSIGKHYPMFSIAQSEDEAKNKADILSGIASAEALISTPSLILNPLSETEEVIRQSGFDLQPPSFPPLPYFPSMDFWRYHFALPPGINDIVVPVSSYAPASAIAYSLASYQYMNLLQEASYIAWKRKYDGTNHPISEECALALESFETRMRHEEEYQTGQNEELLEAPTESGLFGTATEIPPVDSMHHKDSLLSDIEKYSAFRSLSYGEGNSVHGPMPEQDNPRTRSSTHDATVGGILSQINAPRPTLNTSLSHENDDISIPADASPLAKTASDTSLHTPSVELMSGPGSAVSNVPLGTQNNSIGLPTLNPALFDSASHGPRAMDSALSTPLSPSFRRSGNYHTLSYSSRILSPQGPTGVGTPQVVNHRVRASTGVMLKLHVPGLDSLGFYPTANLKSPDSAFAGALSRDAASYRSSFSSTSSLSLSDDESDMETDESMDTVPPMREEGASPALLTDATTEAVTSSAMLSQSSLKAGVTKRKAAKKRISTSHAMLARMRLPSESSKSALPDTDAHSSERTHRNIAPIPSVHAMERYFSAIPLISPTTTSTSPVFSRTLQSTSRSNYNYFQSKESDAQRTHSRSDSILSDTSDATCVTAGSVKSVRSANAEALFSTPISARDPCFYTDDDCTASNAPPYSASAPEEHYQSPTASSSIASQSVPPSSFDESTRQSATIQVPNPTRAAAETSRPSSDPTADPSATLATPQMTSPFASPALAGATPGTPLLKTGHIVSAPTQARLDLNFGVPLCLTPLEMLRSEVRSDFLHAFSDKETLDTVSAGRLSTVQNMPLGYQMRPVPAPAALSVEIECHWAAHFHALRELLGLHSYDFIGSIVGAYSWSATGGKSGAKFDKTRDGRFIIKYLSKTQYYAFVQVLAAKYFTYMADTLSTNAPTLMNKIFGAFVITSTIHTEKMPVISLQNPGSPTQSIHTQKRSRQLHYCLILENIFFDHSIPPGLKFDLKGKGRSQKRNPSALTLRAARAVGAGGFSFMPGAFNPLFLRNRSLFQPAQKRPVPSLRSDAQPPTPFSSIAPPPPTAVDLSRHPIFRNLGVGATTGTVATTGGSTSGSSGRTKLASFGITGQNSQQPQHDSSYSDKFRSVSSAADWRNVVFEIQKRHGQYSFTRKRPVSGVVAPADHISASFINEPALPASRNASPLLTGTEIPNERLAPNTGVSLEPIQRPNETWDSFATPTPTRDALLSNIKAGVGTTNVIAGSHVGAIVSAGANIGGNRKEEVEATPLIEEMTSPQPRLSTLSGSMAGDLVDFTGIDSTLLETSPSLVEVQSSDSTLRDREAEPKQTLNAYEVPVFQFSASPFADARNEAPIAVGDDIVLLDDDFLEYSEGLPLPLTAQAKKYMSEALYRDTRYLCDAHVIDYSILVGVNPQHRTIYLSLIDYCRRYDLAAKIESGMKTVTALATNIEPTVVEPVKYAERLIRACDKYFHISPSNADE